MAAPDQEQREPEELRLSRAPTGLGAEPLNIVILGASFAGLSCAHHFLDHTINRLRITQAAPQYRLIIISPSTHLFWNIAAPRALVSPHLIKQEDLFLPVEAAFHRQRAHYFSIVQGEAVALDPSTRTVTVQLIGSTAQKRASYIGKRSSWSRAPSMSSVKAKVQRIHYHAIIMATGSAAHSDLLSLHGPHLNTIGALNKFHARVAAANTIAVCGSGPSGVEVAGQLATHLNYDYHWPFRKRAKHAKKILLLTGSDRCLPMHKARISTKAEAMLTKLGVEVKHGNRVTAIQDEFDSSGRAKLTLSNNTFLIVDIYIPCTGVGPNSFYAPVQMKDMGGYVRTDSESLRVNPAIAGPRTYAIGDVASYSRNCLQDVYAAVPVLMRNLLNDLLKHEYERASPYGGNQDRIDLLVDARYKARSVDTLYCPISRFGGVGTIRDMSVPQWWVHMVKGRRYRIGKAKKVAEGDASPYPVRKGTLKSTRASS